jgi:hypothetical protein
MSARPSRRSRRRRRESGVEAGGDPSGAGGSASRPRAVLESLEELEEGQRRPCCCPGCRHRERTGGWAPDPCSAGDELRHKARHERSPPTFPTGATSLEGDVPSRGRRLLCVRVVLGSEYELLGVATPRRRSPRRGGLGRGACHRARRSITLRGVDARNRPPARGRCIECALLVRVCRASLSG